MTPRRRPSGHRPNWRRALADEQGAAVVEFAIVVPILLVLVMAIIDFGRMMAVAASLAAAVREGGRQAATATDLSDPTQVSAIRSRVTSAFQSLGGPAIGAAGGGTLTVASVADASGNVAVSVNGYTYRCITPIATMIGMGTVTFNRTATFRWERTQ